MKSRTLILTSFIAVALIQLLVPAKMIWDQEEVMRDGKVFRFKTEPIDPNDPFRGKYITLSFQEENTNIDVENESYWMRGEQVFVTVKGDNETFATITSVSKLPPSETSDYLEANVGYVSGNGENIISIDFPFDRFYMEESKAPIAEETFRQTRSDSSITAYAVVYIKDGESVLHDVQIDGISISRFSDLQLEQ